MLRTVPTVYLDRLNIGGSESGQAVPTTTLRALKRPTTLELDGVSRDDAGDNACTAGAVHGASDLFRSRRHPGDGRHTGRRRRAALDRRVQVDMVLKKGFSAPQADAALLLERFAAGRELPRSRCPTRSATSTAKATAPISTRLWLQISAVPCCRTSSGCGDDGADGDRLVTLTGISTARSSTTTPSRRRQATTPFSGSFTFYENNRPGMARRQP